MSSCCCRARQCYYGVSSSILLGLLRDWRPRSKCAASQPKDTSVARAIGTDVLIQYSVARVSVHKLHCDCGMVTRAAQTTHLRSSADSRLSAHALSRQHLTPPPLDTPVRELWEEGHHFISLFERRTKSPKRSGSAARRESMTIDEIEIVNASDSDCH